jgi:proline iminopeptidase
VGKFLAVLGAAIGAALAGLTTTLAVASWVTAPAVFLGAGTLTGIGVWLVACRAVRRRRRSAADPFWLAAGLLAVAVMLVSALAPLADPVQSPATPPGVGTWRLDDGAVLRYGRVGAAAGRPPAIPLVVVHGGPGVPDLAGQLAALAPVAADGRDAWAYEQRGTGLSTRLADPRGYTVRRAVDDLEQVRLRIGASRMVLLGHSHGAFVVVAYLAAHPDRVDKVIFSSPGDLDLGGLGGRPQERLTVGQRWRVYRLLLAPRALLAYALVQVNPPAAHALAGDRELDARQDRVYAASAPALHCPGHTATALHRLGFYANQVPQALRHPPVPDVRTPLTGTPTPALVIKGQCDYLDWGSAVDYLEVFPSSVLAYLPGAGHEAYLDRPGPYTAAVRAFLNGTPVPGRRIDPRQTPEGYQP